MPPGCGSSNRRSTPSNGRKALVRLARPSSDHSPFCHSEHEWRRGGNTPAPLARLRWGEVGGAVEAKGAGCERGLLFRWRWHGGGEGTAGTSSQKPGGGLSAPQRTIILAEAQTGGGALPSRLRTSARCAQLTGGEHGGGTHLSPSRHIRPLCSTSEQQ